MSRIAKTIKGAWNRLRIQRYQERQAALERHERDAAERLEHQEVGGSSYGPPPMGQAAL